MGVRHPRTLAGRRPSPPTLILAALLTVSVVLLVLLALGTFSLPVDSKLGRARRSVHEAMELGREGSGGRKYSHGSREPGAKGLRLSQFPEHGEGLQILHYEVGQKYEPHYDYFLDEFNTKNGGQRLATILMYLSDVEEGGETVFPSAKVNSSSLPWYNELSECGKKGLSVKPKMGDALLFWSMRPYATLDPSSLHGGCPVIKGNKQSSTKWIHDQAFRA